MTGVTSFFEYASPFTAALVASLIGGALATTLGAVPVLWVRQLSPKTSNAMLSFAAGVMLAALVFSLLLPGVEMSRQLFANQTVAVLAVAGSLLLGGLSMAVVNRLLPHEHFFKGPEGPESRRIGRVWLFVLAITVHNFPEGLSIGVGAASGDAHIGTSVTLGIGLQNIPEGLSVALALVGLGYSRGYALRVAALTGVVELVGGVVGAGLLALSTRLLPLALAFASGTMLFVLSDEVIPETHRGDFGESATTALFAGFCLMLVLDLMFH